MMRYLSILLILGFASAELNVGDRVKVPLTLFSLTFKKDYLEASDSGSARVILKNPYAYVLTMDTVDIPEFTVKFIIPSDSAMKTAYLIDTIISQVVPAVQSFFGNVNYFDSDNDPRIFIVLGGFYVSGEIGLNDRGDIVGYYDPYYSTSSVHERHEYFILNCNSIFTGNNCSKSFDKISLRKTLYYLYTLYTLYSIKGSMEDPFALAQSAFYLASKIDTFSTDTFAYGFQGNKKNIVYVSDDVLNGSIKYYFAPNPTKPYVSQVALAYTLDDAIAQNTYFFFLNLEEKYGFNNLKQMILNTSIKFYNQFDSDTLKALILNTHLKNLLNSKGFGYDYQNYNKEIYPWTGTNSIYNALRPDVRWFSQGVMSGLGFVARAVAVVNKPFIFNWVDSSRIKVFKIDTVDKTISEIQYNPYRLFVDSLRRHRERLFFINVDNKSIDVLYYNNDTTGPTYDTFFVAWNRFSLNTFEIYLRSQNSIGIDVGKFNRLLIKVETPTLNYSPIVEMNLKEEVGSNHYYYAKLVVPKLDAGIYKFSVYDARDSFDNVMVNKPSYSINVQYLNPQVLSIFYDGEIMIRNLDNKVNVVLVSKVGQGYNINSINDFPAYIYIKSQKPENVIYYNNKPVETYYSNGYVYALYQGDGFYSLSTGKPNIIFNYYLKGNSLIINSPINSSIYIRVYDISGKKVYETNKVISEGYNNIPLNLRTGVYIFKIKYDNKDYEFKGIIRR
ncbi:MAG: T9SS type A sorting domain-containing protein [candidate division WOR-3 bacterium]